MVKQMVLGIVAVILVLLGVILWSVGDRAGAAAEGDRFDRMKASRAWNSKKNRFGNELKRVDGSFWEMGLKFFFGGSKHRLPTEPIVSDGIDESKFGTQPASGLRITWFGHSSFLVEIDSLRVLVDPVWTERASPFTWAGPKRFYQPPIALEALPSIDVVVISHDHYDHLDAETVKVLSEKVPQWFVPLGVGAHLEHWGVPSTSIAEFDWWEERVVAGVRFVATPARHFSGRSALFLDQNKTLWAGWAIQGSKRRLFYSGDTALHPEFADIGERLGPFDVTLMETGAYNQLWSDVHLGPEQAVIAHDLVKGGVMIPVHWGLFDLALHGWTEPVERVLVAAQRMNVPIAVLKPGGQFDTDASPRVDRWWPELPWDDLSVAPAWSTSVEAFQEPFLLKSEQSPKVKNSSSL